MICWLSFFGSYCSNWHCGQCNTWLPFMAIVLQVTTDETFAVIYFTFLAHLLEHTLSQYVTGVNLPPMSLPVFQITWCPSTCFWGSTYGICPGYPHYCRILYLNMQKEWRLISLKALPCLPFILLTASKSSRIMFWFLCPFQPYCFTTSLTQSSLLWIPH